MGDAIVNGWNAWLDWSMSAEGRAITDSAILPFIAILAGGVFAAILARGGIARLLTRQDREQKAAVVASALAASRRAGAWGQLSLSEQDHLDYTVAEAFAHIRMTPATGSDLAAEWGTLKVRVIKQKSLAGPGSAESEIRDLEDWLILWHRKPRRAAQHFRDDLELLRYAANEPFAAAAAYQTPRPAARVDSGELAGMQR